MQAQIIEGFRLSPQQRRVWLLQQDSLVYRAQCALLLEGDLRTEIFRESVQAVINRHEILRTTFHLPTGMRVPFQVVRDSSIPSWYSVDLSGLSPEEQEAKIQDLFQEQARLLFNFEQGPLLHFSLLTLSGQKHVLLVCLPSLCGDVASLKNLVCEISQCYAARLRGEEVSGEEQRYVQFSEWQNELLEVQHETGKDYWRRLGLSALPALMLPFENHSRAKLGFDPAFLTLTIKADIVAEIEALFRKYDTSTLVFLLACWQTLLWRLTGQADVVIATGFDGRKFEELHGALGLFAQSLPIRGHCEQNSQFSEILSQAREATRDAYEWQEYFTTDTSVGSGEDSADSALFPIGFEFEEQLCKYNADGVSFCIYKEHVYTDRFKIMLRCVRSSDSFITEFHYDPTLFLADDIERVAEQFHTLLKSALNDPETAISKLEILSDVERQRLVVEWNNTKTGSPKEKCVQQLFEEQAERTPDNIAVAYEDQQLTYEELNCRANQLARYLQKLGVGPETPVAICVERSLEMVIGLLGVLKAGGAYVPLDPVLPGERLSFMLEDTQAPVLLTQQKVVESLPKHTGKLVCLDTDWNMIAQQSRDNITSGATSKNLAYVLFTSGSTGKPKGVTVEHRQLLNYLDGILQKLDLPAGASFATVSTFAADLGNTAIFPSLCAGGCLHIVSQERASDPDALADYFARHPIDCLKIVPSHLETLLASPCPERVLPRKRLVLGGEASSWNLIKKLQELAPDCVILNHYGPTETTVGVITYRVEKSQIDSRSATLPIGRPISNTEIYLLDSRLRPVPIWVPGELYIGGDSVTRGYLNRPELTAEKFIPNPFGAGSRSRLCKTGDLARYLPDGSIEFLGRVDNQVKIRGFRIELGEIEAVLKQHPSVHETVVLAREDVTEEQRDADNLKSKIENPKLAKRLVAYVVSNQEPAPATSELRSFLKEKLPDYMVPSAFIFLDALPLTPNGKVDRRALPPPDQSRPELKDSFVPPRTPAEKTIAEIWTQVLKVDKVGIHDNFFDLSGHSLLATQVMSRLTKAFQIELTLRSLFKSPTVASLAERIEETRRGKMGFPVLPILPRPRDGDLPLSFAQQRLWFLDQLEPNSSVYNIPSRLRLKGPLDITALEQSLNEIVRRHEALRTTFSTFGGEPVQVISPSLTLPLSVLDVSDRPETERETEARRLATEDAQRPFDLARGPLLRVALLRLGHEDHVLLLTMHHIASDGWSAGILSREVSALYEAFSRGKPSPLPDLPIQYADFAVWQRQWLQGEVLEAQLSYWRKQLENVTPLQLPTDRPRPAMQSYRGARQSLVLAKDLSEKLKDLSRKEGVTLFMTLLAAFQTLLYRYTGQEDIAVGSPIAGRNRAEIEGLIGFFVNTLVLRTDVSGNLTFKELLERVRGVCLGAYSHQDLPFEKLVEELQPERNLSHNPLFQVMLVLQNASTTALKIKDLSVSPLRVDSETAKFDLTLSMREEKEGLRGSLQYNTDLFDDATTTRMLGHFQTMLEGIISNPDQRLSDLPILTEAEKREFLVECNDTKRAYPKDRCIHELFEAQVESTPDAVAVVFEDQQLTYRELNRRANQFAHHLKKLGVGPEVLVGICVDRSLEMVIGVLGILKAGGAYVPLDPTYPKERLAFMLEDSQVSVVLTQKHLLEKLPEHRGEVVCLDKDWELTSHEREYNPSVSVTAENLAYMIYTSGSTGKPKGVAVPHRAVNRLLINTDYVNLESTDVVAQVSNCSFDAATFEIWGALLHGAKLVVVTTDVAIFPKNFAEQIEQKKISVLFLTTALFNQMARELPAAFKTVRHLLFGGEAVDPKWVAEVLKHGPPERLLHVYGPTETTTFASWHLVKNIPGGTATVPIGRPISNTELYVLDLHLQPLPMGAPGELYIGGDGLARGYLKRPDLAAEKFIPNPFSEEPGAHLYKTGDLARYLPDGNIEFLGRIDNQVKIRGFRIELGEIEAVLKQHPSVHETVVLAREDVTEEQRDADNLKSKIENPKLDKRLVAYVVSNQEPAPATSELRSFLKEKLPDFMVPSTFVFLDSLPLTPNGKVDRRALPAPGRVGSEDGATYVPPNETAEHQLTQIWEDLLGVRPVGIQDNFFNLGGHSLLAVQMMHRIEQVCGEKLPLSTLLAGPTIEHLTKALVKQRVEDNESLLVKVQSGAAKHPFFFLHGDFHGGGFYCLDLARRLGEDQPLYALTPFGLNGEPAPETIEAMAASYIEMIRNVEPAGPYILGGLCNGGVVAFEMARQLQSQGQKVDLVVLVTARAWNSPHLRFLQDLVSGVGGFLGLGPEERMNLFLGLRDRKIRLHQLCRRSLNRLKEVAELSLGEQVAWALRLASRVPWGAVRRIVPGGWHEGTSSIDQAGAMAKDQRQNIDKVYGKALASYVPRYYSGRVALLWAAEVPINSLGKPTVSWDKAADPTLGWSRVADEVEAYEVPGGWTTSLTRHVDVLAGQMKACLDKAQANGRRDNRT